jgi:hypothetical protein
MFALLIYILLSAPHKTHQCVPIKNIAPIDAPVINDPRPTNIGRPNIVPSGYGDPIANTLSLPGYNPAPVGYNVMPYILVPVGMSPNNWPWGALSPTCPCNLSATTTTTSQMNVLSTQSIETTSLQPPSVSPMLTTTEAIMTTTTTNTSPTITAVSPTTTESMAPFVQEETTTTTTVSTTVTTMQEVTTPTMSTSTISLLNDIYLHHINNLS